MITNGGFLTMGTKRIGLARFEALLENLKREIKLGAGTSIGGAKRIVEQITIAKTLTEGDSGKVFAVDADSGAYDITLPANATTGWHCTFLMADIAGNNIDIVAATADTIEGVIVDASPTNMDAADKITFVGGTSVLGDQIEIVSTNGATWFARAFSGANGGITATG